VQIHKVVSSNLTNPNPCAKNGGSTIEEYGDTGQVFNNTEINNQDKAKVAVDVEEYSRLSGKNASGQHRSRIGSNGCYIEYEPKKNK